MKTKFVAILATLALVSSDSAAQTLVGRASITATPSLAILDTTGMFRAQYAQAGADVFIAGQPTERALRAMKEMGVTTVINLRMPEEMTRVSFDEAKLIAELGMTYVHLPSRGGNGPNAYSPETLRKFTDAMQSAKGKVLLHCTVAWRASHLWGAYLIQRGLSEADALTHTRAIALMDDHRMEDGAQPLELFLGRKVKGIGEHR